MQDVTPQLRTRRCLGMTLAETLIAAIAVVMMFAFLSAVSASLRQDDAETRTQDTLATLQRALMQHGQPLSEDTPQALRQLLADPQVRPMLAAIRIERSPEGDPMIRDAYGYPIVYQPHPSAGANGLMPGQFVSPGPDGRLGDPQSDDPAQRRAAADNLHGYDTQVTRP